MDNSGKVAAGATSPALVQTVVDTRETELIDAMREVGAPFIVEQLDLGDIVFRHNDTPVLVIERKTLKDLAASIKDGRAREQKARLIDLYVKQGIKTMYLIEEFHTPNMDRCNIPFTTLLSSVVNTMVRDNISVYHTPNLQMSAKTIIRMGEKINEHFAKGLFATQETDYISQLKLKKKDNKRVDDSMIFILCQVPKVSPTVAEVIREKYPSVMALCAAYSELEDEKERELLLSTLRLNEKRRIGKVISTNVYKYFC